MTKGSVCWGAIVTLCISLFFPVVVQAQRVGPWPLRTNQERSISIDGAENCRDLGGLPARGGYIKNGMFFRTASLNGLTDEGVDHLRRLGWRTIVDLRRPEEFSDGDQYDRAPDGYGVGWRFWRRRCQIVSLPMDIDKSRNADMYESYLLDNPKAIRGFFKLLSAEHNYPIDVHCACGKDRTGIVVALVLELLGTPRPLIYDDFLYSSNVEWMMVNVDDLKRCFDIIDNRFGGIRSYLRAQGIKDKEMDAIPRFLVEEREWKTSKE